MSIASNSLENILGYKFHNINLLYEAISHPSLRGDSNFEGKDYERLEFLGDAVINLVITESLYLKFPDYEEGELAKIRAYLVCKDFMVQKASELGLGNHIIMAFSEESSGGRKNPNNLENVLEAIIGAIYIDGGFVVASKVVQNIWGAIKPEDSLLANPKSALQELLQDQKMPIPLYEVVDKAGQIHAPTYKVKVLAGTDVEFGYGSNIKAAEKDAATKMVAKLKAKNDI